MNLHPIFVHFPIALLTIYTIFEFLRFSIIKRQSYWFYVKAILVICGTIGSVVAVLTGDEAKHAVLQGTINPLVANPRYVISLHETWAHISTIIFILLAAGYAVAWLNKLNFKNYLPGTLLKLIWELGTKIEYLIIETKLVFVLAVIGLIAITITGALGGSIVYGPNTDPVVHFIYQTLVK